MVTGRLLQLSCAISGGVLDIYSSLSLLYYTFLHHTVANDYMNVRFLITHQISSKNKLFRANKILWLNLTVKYSFVFSRFTRFCRFRF
jgi:hypothetical protein